MQSIWEKINFQDNKEALEYYEYIRSITQVVQLSYWIGNPSVQIISGRILLQPFRPVHSKKQPQNYQLYLKQILQANTYQSENGQQKSLAQQQSKEDMEQSQSPKKSERIGKKCIKSRCLVLCGIPNSKSPVQVMETQCLSRNRLLIKQIRVIKTVHIKYYGMLFLMEDQQSAGQFFNDLFGTQYNDLQMERIIVREIKAITLTFSQLNVSGVSNQMNLLRSIKEDSEYIAPQNIFMTFHHQRLKQKVESTKVQKKQNFSQQLVCAICFQECNTQQAISILCGHYFDFQCLEKWSQNICPLCRYHQQPPIIKFCQKCNQCQGLWICLICGSRLCCGVNNDILSSDSHIYDHYKVTSHSLSMQLQTKFLFDAKLPAFLHQKFYRDLVQNQSQEKISMEEKNIQENNKKDKITQQIQQYEIQVSQQMKRQRLYFEQQINQSMKAHRILLCKKRQRVEQLRTQLQRIQSEQEQALKQTKQIEQTVQKKGKQLDIIKSLISLKQGKVQQKKQRFSQNHKLKLTKLKQLQTLIKQKKQEILDYRKNLKLKQKLSQKLKGQQVSGDFIMIEADGKNNKKNKKGSNR